jgi:hypothetical protein
MEGGHECRTQTRVQLWALTSFIRPVLIPCLIPHLSLFASYFHAHLLLIQYLITNIPLKIQYEAQTLGTSHQHDQ